MKSTTLYSTSSNGTTSCNCEYVFNRHKERLICSSFRIRNIRVNCLHKLHDLIAPLTLRIFQSLESGTLDNRAVIESIFFKLFCDFHFYQFKQLRIINHITLVHKYYDIGNAYLTGQKDMLLCLSHNTVSSSYYQDSTIHLSCTSDHVLNVVSMSRAVNVCIVSLFC